MAFDADGNGTLTESELKAGLKELAKDSETGKFGQNEMEKALACAGLTQHDLDDLLKYLGSGLVDQRMGEDGIDYEQFVLGLFSLGEIATRKDAMEIMSDLKDNEVENQRMDVRLKNVEQSIQELHLDFGERMEEISELARRRRQAGLS